MPKVVSELKLDEVQQPSVYKSAMLSLIEKYIDIFAKSDSDVCTTSVVFYEIDTADCRQLRQPACRIMYGDMQKAVE
jgi:hypothetical protein